MKGNNSGLSTIEIAPQKLAIEMEGPTPKRLLVFECDSLNVVFLVDAFVVLE